MTRVAPNLNPAVNLAWNLTALHASVKQGALDEARGVARRVAADPVAIHESLESVVGPWRNSALHRSVARFGSGQDVDLEDVLLSEVHRLKATIPDLHVRLIEKLFDVADAISVDFEKRFFATLDDRQGLNDLKTRLEGRLDLFREIRKELSKNYFPDCKFTIADSGHDPSELESLYRRYDSSYWQTLYNSRSVISAIVECELPIPADHWVHQVVKSEREKTRDLDDRHSFIVTPSRHEFVHGLVNELLYKAQNKRWESGILFFELPLDAYPAQGWMNSAMKDLAWPPPADDFRLLSFQRVSGFKLGFEVIGDKVRVSIDFGKTLRTR